MDVNIELCSKLYWRHFCMVAFTLLLEGQLVDFQCSRESLMWKYLLLGVKKRLSGENFPELFTFNYVDVCVSFSVALCSTVQWCAMYIRWHIVLLNTVERNFQHLQNILKLAVSSVHEWLQHLTLVLCVFHRQEKLVDDHLKICEWTCSVFDRALLVSNMILYLCLLSRINTGTGQLWYHHLVSTKC